MYDFPNSPTLNQVFGNYTWDGEKWKQLSTGFLPSNSTPLMDGTAAVGTSVSFAREDHIHPTDTKKKYIVNGAMMVSQENGTTAGSTLNYFPVDQFASNFVGTSGSCSYAQVASPTPGGSSNRLRVTVATADAVVDVGDLLYVQTLLEGLRVADLKSGTSGAKTVTIQFGVKAPAGTYCVTVRNGPTSNRTYTAEYVIAAGEANTDVVKSVTLQLDTGGTWVSDNTAALIISWPLMCGTNFRLTANTWTAGNLGASANQFNLLGTLGNIFELFDVSLTVGSIAPPFTVPDYASELAACQRYYFKRTAASDQFTVMQAFNGTSVYGKAFDLPVTMRATPTTAMSSLSHIGIGNASGSVAAPATSGSFNASSPHAIGTSSLAASTAALVAGNASALAFLVGAASGWISANARL